MTFTEQIITIAAIVHATMLTRFLPFIVFPSGKPTPKYIRYLGKVLPAGTDCDCGCRSAAPVEAADAFVNCRQPAFYFSTLLRYICRAASSPFTSGSRIPPCISAAPV